MPNPIRALGVSVAAACVAMLSVSVPSSASKPIDDNAKKLGAMLAKYDAMKPGAPRDALARDIDAFAGQRYATVSRLYWYQDLETAKAAAKAQHRPILALRMLGRLDEEQSCANSRFFRTTLYANAETSKFLRDNFVLYWSSERPVPRVTIDFGDGRKIERTVTGNSAHYVLDDAGNVLDALPGLYAPLVFRSELAKSLALANQVRGLDRILREDAIVAFHQAALKKSQETYRALAGTQYISRRGRLIGVGEIGAAAIERAQRVTYAKMAVESVDLRTIGIDAGAIDPTDLAQWATIGQKAWNIGLATAKPPAPGEPVRLARRGDVSYPAPMLLDAQSIKLVEQVRAGNPLAMKSDALIARLEQNILADTALNEFRLRTQIRGQLVTRRGIDWATLNDFIYASVFHTPKDDAWLGLLDNADFTGLPADGVVKP